MLTFFRNCQCGQLRAHYSRYGYLTCDIDKADICISINEAHGEQPSGLMVASYENQKFYMNEKELQYSFQSSIANCVWGKSSPPFFDVQIFCDHMESACAFRAIQEVILQFFRYREIYLGKLVVHASAVVSSEGCIAFSGSSGDGKSTQAHLWVQHQNAYILNDDKPIICIEAGVASICGSPWSGKGNQYINEKHLLSAMVFLRKDRRNSIRKLSLAETFSYIYINNMPYFYCDEIARLYEQAVWKYADVIPAYLLSCLPNEDATSVVRQVVFGRGGVR